MSFLLDPPSLYATAKLYGRAAPEPAQGRLAVVAGASTVALFWGTSVALYLDRPWTRPLWRLFRARDGRDFMWGSGVIHPDTVRAGARAHSLAATMFALYPLWFWAGWDSGRRTRS